MQSRSQQTEDLTDQREALEAAVRDARADREGLRARLAKATTDKERSRLRALVDRATRRVTQRQRQVNELGRDVSYATVDLEIRGTRRSGDGAPPPGDRWTPGDALGDAVRVLEVIAGVLADRAGDHACRSSRSACWRRSRAASSPAGDASGRSRWHEYRPGVVDPPGT